MKDLIAVGTTCPNCHMGTVHHVSMVAYGRLVAGLSHNLSAQVVTGVCCDAVQEAA